ncbi:membrane integrity-associated transporter subunit PqiC [Jannaschia sp. KMU-145]|uniref:PqiC family protein n=1 Tax=Jannaschia halovivens TaxID=3388667 RepID=UPI00396AEFC1
MRLPLALCLLIAACGQTQYFTPPPVTTDLRVNVRANTAMINEPSIPEYAINQEIPIQQADGSLVTDTDRLWADLPDRALSASLMRHLNVITDAQVAVEPWPLSGFPDTEISVFVEDMIVQANGTLLFTGTFALGPETGRGRIDPFSITVPVVDQSYPTIIAAHEAAWLRLAEEIAQAL